MEAPSSLASRSAVWLRLLNPIPGTDAGGGTLVSAERERSKRRIISSLARRRVERASLRLQRPSLV